MATKYVTAGPWGPGEGAPLDAPDIDQNFYGHELRIEDLELNPPEAAGISNIQVIGSQLMIFLSDGQQFGPYTLPVAAIQFKGEYIPGVQYFELDVVSKIGYGLFLVRKDHVGPDPFNPDLIVDGDDAYTKLFGDDPSVYHFGLFIPGKPGEGIASGRRLFSHLFATDVFISADFPGSVAELHTAPDDGDLVFEIMKNDDIIGSLIFTNGNTIPSFVLPSEVQFSAGDRFSIIRPDDIDSMADELTATFVGVRGTLPDEIS